jgi:serine/threonine-protein kinase RsbW
VIFYNGAEDLPKVRAFVRERARSFGLGEEPVERLALAVSELVTNTLQHTTGGGEVRMRADGATVCCEVVDGGPMRVWGQNMPAADAERGRGLVIVERLCDEVTAFTESGRTVVRLRMAPATESHRRAAS